MVEVATQKKEKEEAKKTHAEWVAEVSKKH